MRKIFGLAGVWVLAVMVAMSACSRKLAVLPTATKPTETLTSTATLTATASKTTTPTLTATATSTYTPTSTSTWTWTSVPTATSSSTNTFTATFTATATATNTNTFTSTSTNTQTNTWTATSVSTDTWTPTPDPTDTPTDTPTTTATDTSTACVYTPPTGLVCVDTPTNPIVVSELEPPCDGGPDTGTNDSCATAENIGTVTQSQSVVVAGVLANSGNDGTYLNANDDFDLYEFTIGETGNYNITLDCFTTGTDGEWLQLQIIDSACSSQLWGGTNFDGTNYSTSISESGAGLTAGSQYILAVVGIAGTPLQPYRISIDPVPPTPTPGP